MLKIQENSTLKRFSGSQCLSAQKDSRKVCVGALAGPLDFVAGGPWQPLQRVPMLKSTRSEPAGVSRADCGRRREVPADTRCGVPGRLLRFSLPCSA